MAVNMPHTIRSCRECPFMQRSPIPEADVVNGWEHWSCSLLRLGEKFIRIVQFQRIHGADSANWAIPDICPLKMC